MMNIVKVKELGYGMFGCVVSAIDKNNNNNKVALKYIYLNDKINFKGDESILELLIDSVRELNFTRLLKSPNIINIEPLVFNDGTKSSLIVNDDKKVGLSLELLDGDVFGLLINKKLTLEDVRKMVYDVTNGLYHMHSMGFTHNDIKTDNIMYKLVDGVYNFKIADFGVSQYLGMPIPRLCYGFIGAPMPPDAKDSKVFYLEGNKYNYNSDMFGLGETMFSIYMEYNNLDFEEFLEKNRVIDIRKKGFLSHIGNLKKMYGEDGFDFLMKCLQPKTSNRMSSKKALHHPYINQFYGGAPSSIFKTIKKLYNEPTIQELTNSVYELEYLDDMYNLYKDKTVNLFVDFKKQRGKINETNTLSGTEMVYSVFEYLKLYTLESFFQYQLNVKNMLNIKKDINNNDFEFYSLNLFRLCDKLYSNIGQDNHTLEDYKMYKQDTILEMCEIQKDILKRFNYQIPFVPVMPFLTYWYLNSIYRHPIKKPNMKILTTSISIMFVILSSNLAILENVKMDDLAKYSIHKAIRLKSYTKYSNVSILKVEDNLEDSIDKYMNRFILEKNDFKFFKMIQEILLDNLDNIDDSCKIS